MLLCVTAQLAYVNTQKSTWQAYKHYCGLTNVLVINIGMHL